MKSSYESIERSRSSSVVLMPPVEAAFITDTKVKRNALCDEWPNYMSKN